MRPRVQVDGSSEGIMKEYNMTVTTNHAMYREKRRGNGELMREEEKVPLCL